MPTVAKEETNREVQSISLAGGVKYVGRWTSERGYHMALVGQHINDLPHNLPAGYTANTTCKD